MRMHRFFTDQPLAIGAEVRLQDKAAHYLGRVLRVAVGQKVLLFNGDGLDYPSEAIQMRRDQAILRVRDSQPAAAESPLRITLVQALIRGERMDYALQKATELGVAAVQPVLTARSEVRLPASRQQARMQHWLGVIRAACEQSGRACIPDLHAPLDLLEWSQQSAGCRRLVLSPLASRSLGSSQEVRTEVQLLIGPEGGFEETELQQLRQASVVEVSLGPRVLRSETAGPAAIAVLQALCGDLAGGLP